MLISLRLRNPFFGKRTLDIEVENLSECLIKDLLFMIEQRYPLLRIDNLYMYGNCLKGKISLRDYNIDNEVMLFINNYLTTI